MRVTNKNDQRVLFTATSLSGCVVDDGGWVRPHASRTFPVHQRRIRWTAAIGSYPFGIADQGTVRDIEPGPAPDGATSHC